jgi:hypothetical protein
MARKKRTRKFLQEARERMERKGTVGAFTRQMGGHLTEKKIRKAEHSRNPKTRKRAVFAENMRKIARRRKHRGRGRRM